MKISKKKRGQAIVELALLFPVFLLVIIGGIVDFGFAFYNMLALQQVANDAAQTGAEKNFSDVQMQDYINRYKAPPIGWHSSGIYTTNITTISMQDGSQMKRVTLKYNSKIYTPFYQTAIQTVTGHDYLELRTQATYKVPNTVRNREDFSDESISISLGSL